MTKFTYEEPGEMVYATTEVTPIITLRDYLAGKAIGPIAADCIDNFRHSLSGDEPDWETVAAQAYRLADAMLEARKK